MSFRDSLAVYTGGSAYTTGTHMCAVQQKESTVAVLAVSAMFNGIIHSI